MKEYIEREAVMKYLAKCADGYSYIETPTESAIANIRAIPAADVADAGYKAFAEWVARIIFDGGLEDEAFCELACRKLNDLGIVEKTKSEWHFDDPTKSITPAYLVETRHGKWINAYPEIEQNPMFMYGICSVCGFEQSVSDKLKYCPNCGAKMDGGDNR